MVTGSTRGRNSATRAKWVGPSNESNDYDSDGCRDLSEDDDDDNDGVSDGSDSVLDGGPRLGIEQHHRP